VQRFPRLDPALEGALLPVAELPPVTILQILEQGRRVQRRLFLQQRDDLALPDLLERIVARSPTPFCLLHRTDSPTVDPLSCALRHPRYRAG